MSETHWKKLTNPNYLGSWDFQKGEERILTISHIEQKELFNPTSNSQKPCMVACFVENSKPMVLNKTNCKMIQKLYKTPIIERWAGCKIIVTVQKVKSFGKVEEALRIKDQIPRKTQSTVVPKCSDCGKEIRATEKLSAEQVSAGGIKKFGRPVCAECGNQLKEGVISNVSVE